MNNTCPKCAERRSCGVGEPCPDCQLTPLRKQLKASKEEVKNLTQYILYVEARIGTSEVPDTYENWNAAVNELAADLEEALAKPEKHTRIFDPDD